MNTLTSCTLVALVAATTTGCIIIPDWKKTVVAGRRIEPAKTAFIRSGETTLSNVVERLGEPTAAFEDLRIVAYEWTYVRDEMIGWMWAETEYVHKVFFVAGDEKERVKRPEVRSRSYGKTLRRQAAKCGYGFGGKRVGLQQNPLILGL
jgi:hypothetical protein